MKTILIYAEENEKQQPQNNNFNKLKWNFLMVFVFEITSLCVNTLEKW